MPRWVTIVLSLMTLVVACTGLIAWDRVMLQTATMQEGSVGIWVYNPYVGPGGTLVTTIGVYSGLEAGIAAVHVRVGDEMLQVRGEGADWGNQIYTKRSSKGSDALTIEVVIPEDAPVGEALLLEFDVGWVVAHSSGSSRFDNSSRQTQLSVPLGIHPPATRLALRAANLGIALSLLFGFALFLVRVWNRVKALDQGGNKDDAETLGIALVIGGMAYGFFGYWVFALPIVAATDITSTWFIAPLIGLWIVGPPLAAGKTRAWLDDQYRHTFEPGAPVDADIWLRAAAAEGLEIQRRWRFAKVSDKGSGLWFDVGRLSGKIGCFGSNEPVAIRLGLLMVRQVGVVDLTTYGFQVTLGPDDTFEAVEKDLMDHRAASAKDMMERIHRSMGMLNDIFSEDR